MSPRHRRQNSTLATPKPLSHSSHYWVSSRAHHSLPRVSYYQSTGSNLLFFSITATDRFWHRDPPEKHYPFRSFRSSAIVPYSSNIGFLVYRKLNSNSDSDMPEMLLQISVNEHLVNIPGTFWENWISVHNGKFSGQQHTVNIDIALNHFKSKIKVCKSTASFRTRAELENLNYSSDSWKGRIGSCQNKSDHIKVPGQLEVSQNLSDRFRHSPDWESGQFSPCPKRSFIFSDF